MPLWTKYTSLGCGHHGDCPLGTQPPTIPLQGLGQSWAYCHPRHGRDGTTSGCGFGWHPLMQKHIHHAPQGPHRWHHAGAVQPSWQQTDLWVLRMEETLAQDRRTWAVVIRQPGPASGGSRARLDINVKSAPHPQKCTAWWFKSGKFQIQRCYKWTKMVFTIVQFMHSELVKCEHPTSWLWDNLNLGSLHTTLYSWWVIDKEQWDLSWKQLMRIVILFSITDSLYGTLKSCELQTNSKYHYMTMLETRYEQLSRGMDFLNWNVGGLFWIWPEAL